MSDLLYGIWHSHSDDRNHDDLHHDHRLDSDYDDNDDEHVSNVLEMFVIMLLLKINLSHMPIILWMFCLSNTNHIMNVMSVQ